MATSTEQTKTQLDEMLPAYRPRPLYTMKESMALLNIGRTLMYELINEGHIKSKMIGRRRMITHRQLIAFINSQEA
jgi:excisionase family DNA binding protein